MIKSTIFRGREKLCTVAHMIKAIIFDFNGVIVDDEPLHEKAFRQACAEFDVSLSSEEYAALCLGITDRQGAVRIQEKFGLTDEAREKLLQRKSQLYLEFLKHDIHPVVGVIGLIQKLKGKFLLGIATAAYRGEVEFILQELNIRDTFSIIVTAQDVVKSKPDAEPYLAVAKKLGVIPVECVVIEDTPSGIKSAKSAGMTCIAITTTRRRDELKQADFIIDNFSEISSDFSLLKKYPHFDVVGQGGDGGS